MVEDKKDIKRRAYQFALSIIKLIDTFPNQSTYWVLQSQLLKSSTSIGANIIEAKGSSSKKEFIRFFSIALKSANETKFWLCLLRDAKKAKIEQIKPLLKEANELSNMVAASILTMKKVKI